jgi:hypothetical protein
MRRSAALVLALAAALAAAGDAAGHAAADATAVRSSAAPEAARPGARARGLPDEQAAPAGFPEIGFWMLSPGGGIADWLGAPFEGKRLLEPINVLIVDRRAASAEEASARLLAACGKSEFPQREGHSSGYWVRLGSMRYPQFPPGTEESFSDALFVFSNDHGRIFGPMKWDGAYLFAGAFSRESVDPVTKVKHRYMSFDRARDAFAARMSERGGYEIAGYMELGNAVVEDPALSTGDHDGVAVLLSAKP